MDKELAIERWGESRKQLQIKLFFFFKLDTGIQYEKSREGSLLRDKKEE